MSDETWNEDHDFLSGALRGAADEMPGAEVDDLHVSFGVVRDRVRRRRAVKIGGLAGVSLVLVGGIAFGTTQTTLLDRGEPVPPGSSGLGVRDAGRVPERVREPVRDPDTGAEPVRAVGHGRDPGRLPALVALGHRRWTPHVRHARGGSGDDGDRLVGRRVRRHLRPDVGPRGRSLDDVGHGGDPRGGHARRRPRPRVEPGRRGGGSRDERLRGAGSPDRAADRVGRGRRRSPGGCVHVVRTRRDRDRRHLRDAASRGRLRGAGGRLPADRLGPVGDGGQRAGLGPPRRRGRAHPNREARRRATIEPPEPAEGEPPGSCSTAAPTGSPRS